MHTKGLENMQLEYLNVSSSESFKGAEKLNEETFKLCSESCNFPLKQSSCCPALIVVKVVFMITSKRCKCNFVEWRVTFSCCTKLCRHTMKAPPPNILPCHRPTPNPSPVFVVCWRWGKVGRPQERRIQRKSPRALRCGLPSGPGGDLESGWGQSSRGERPQGGQPLQSSATTHTTPRAQQTTGSRSKLSSSAFKCLHSGFLLNLVKDFQFKLDTRQHRLTSESRSQHGIFSGERKSFAE